MTRSVLAIIIMTVLILSACSGIKLQKYPSEKCIKVPGDAAMNVIKDKCFLCHKGDFTTKELTCARKEMITDSVSTKRMPKIGSLSNEQINIILKWDL